MKFSPSSCMGLAGIAKPFKIAAAAGSLISLAIKLPEIIKKAQEISTSLGGLQQTYHNLQGNDCTENSDIESDGVVNIDDLPLQ